jgi:hypothetical protein
MGQEFALHLLDRLKVVPAPDNASRQASILIDGGGGSQTPREGSTLPIAATKGAGEEDVKPSVKAIELADGDNKDDAVAIGEQESTMAMAMAPAATVENGKVIAGLPEPMTEQQVAQHIELLLGLVSKAPDLLDE